VGKRKKNDVVLLLLLFGQIQRLYSSLVLILSGNLDYLCAGPSHLLNLQSSTFLSVICTFSLSIDFGSALFLAIYFPILLFLLPKLRVEF
jgi:hypothetical protein